MNPIFQLLLLLLCICTCVGPAAAKEAVPEGFDCAKGMPGWKRAAAITPDLVPPCRTGSAGKCDDPRYEYVRGTGWCRPRR